MKDFKFKPFDEMTEEDYRTVGFKSGLEVHQQLLTDKKLFCRCPAGRYSQEYNAEILRHMRPTLSEMGEYDGTALMEFKTKKNIIYRIHRDTVCTYEMDDTPPFEINDEALDISIEIGMLFNASIVDELHIARKQYLDGSIPTGFQRTAITCVNGKIPYKDREIDIIQMSIEEDSCREYSDIGHDRIYLTDRLGMPLIETVTAPQMKTPHEVAEVNDVLRRIVRTTGKVRTGIGAGRQDVNVSVDGGTRIEIKGVPRIPYIPELTYNEAMRQWNLLRLREELKNRGITEDTFKADYKVITKLLRKTRFQPIHDAIANGKIVNAVKLNGFKDLLKWQTQTDTFFSKEISDRVRVIACLTTLPNIIHSDNPGETLASSEWKNIKKQLDAAEDDTVVLVWGDPEDAETGAKEIIIRAQEAAIGIPSETRQALRDGTTGFERILPGPQRMYPDTDLPPKKITEERKARIKAQLPEQFWQREKKYRELGIPEDTVSELAISIYADIFDEFTAEKMDPTFAAVTLIQYPKRLRKRRLDPTIINENMMRKIFRAYMDGEVPKDGILYLMEKCVRNGKFLRSYLPKPVERENLNKELENAKGKIENMYPYNPESTDKLLTGMVMDKFRGRIEGREVEDLVKKYEYDEVENVYK